MPFTNTGNSMALTTSQLSLLQAGNYRGLVRFDTTGAKVASPWNISTMSAGTDDHDNVLYTAYNLRHNRGTGLWERVVDNEHGVRFGMESRWTTGDPDAVRGMFEWNLSIERALTGALTFDRAPFYLNYDFDNSKMLMTLGDTLDTGNSLIIHAATAVDKIMPGDGYAFRVSNGDAWFEDDVVLYKTLTFTSGSAITGGNAIAGLWQISLTPDHLGNAYYLDVSGGVIGSAALRVQDLNGIRIGGASWTKNTSDEIVTATGLHVSVPTIGLFNAAVVIGTPNLTGNFAIMSSSAHPTALAGSLGLGTTAPGTLLHALLTDAGTNAVVNVVTIGHDTSGTAAAGFGSGQLFALESSTTAAQSAARIQALWYEATHASRKADLVLTVRYRGA